ncbi:hypothetical protein EAE99_004847 [Botrytis elliptica]|nr:hypothetical protein EAE99_004847 [Botrytis elliptica]
MTLTRAELSHGEWPLLIVTSFDIWSNTPGVKTYKHPSQHLKPYLQTNSTPLALLPITFLFPHITTPTLPSNPSTSKTQSPETLSPPRTSSQTTSTQHPPTNSLHKLPSYAPSSTPTMPPYHSNPHHLDAPHNPAHDTPPPSHPHT